MQSVFRRFLSTRNDKFVAGKSKISYACLVGTACFLTFLKRNPKNSGNEEAGIFFQNWEIGFLQPFQPVLSKHSILRKNNESWPFFLKLAIRKPCASQ